MSLALRLMPEPVRSIAFGAVSPVYMGIGSSMTRPIRMLVLQNLMDIPVMISFDGIDDHLPMAANGYLVLDIAANKTVPEGFFLAEGQRLYIKQLGAIAATINAVYLTTFYGAE